MGASDSGHSKTSLIKKILSFLFLEFNHGVAVSGNMASMVRSVVKDEGVRIGKAAAVA